jgi:hypothetical protein
VAGHQSPHTVLNRYVANYTEFEPTDGGMWQDDEPPLDRYDFQQVYQLNFDRMSAGDLF